MQDLDKMMICNIFLLFCFLRKFDNHNDAALSEILSLKERELVKITAGEPSKTDFVIPDGMA